MVKISQKLGKWLLIWVLARSAFALTIDFQGVPTAQALQYLSQFTKQSMVISDQVKGQMTLHLENVTADQALAMILKIQGLAMENIGPIVFIAPAAMMTREEAVLPLKNTVLRLKYANAEDLAKLLKSKEANFLSKRGVVSVDQRTNTLLLQDTEAQLQKIQGLLQLLDIPVEQVQIAARIVNVDDDYERELGLKFAVSQEMSESERFKVNLPRMPALGGGLALFRVAQGTVLDLELSALETEGHAEIISSPRLVTANRQAAVIESGQEIPYQEQSGNGVTSVTFKKAVLMLKVAPQIIPGKKILLHLTVNQDQRSAKEVLGVPEIDTRHISTQVLVNDGETIVLGGIYEQSSNRQNERVPFFSSLPVVGSLFIHHKQVSSKRELLIFITPTILKAG